MRVDKYGDYFVIKRGKDQPQFFSFCVDDDSSSWSRRFDNAQIYTTNAKAEERLADLRRRAKLARQRRLK
jgi:hypothetical protein